MKIIKTELYISISVNTLPSEDYRFYDRYTDNMSAELLQNTFLIINSLIHRRRPFVITMSKSDQTDKYDKNGDNHCHNFHMMTVNFDANGLMNIEHEEHGNNMQKVHKYSKTIKDTNNYIEEKIRKWIDDIRNP